MKRQKSFANDNAKLYIVSTPIGNLEDITLRAINTLKTVDLIYCEDTRNTVKLLNHYDIKTKMKSFHLFNENEITSEVIGQIKNGLNIALVSDAGSPCISDPGWILVSEAIRNDIDVIVVPGVVAGITALVASGLSTERFTFYGFLSSKQKKRTEELKELKNRTETVILYEAPHRIKATLEDIDAIMPERQIVLARELTKKFEEYSRGTAREILEELDVVKGEMVIVLEGNKETEKDEELINLSIEEHYRFYLDQGMDSKTALKQVATDRGIPKRDIYQTLFKKEAK
ncbi:MAG TPA: 16S rRNA (cytidine(1402)-2'-O)-methyltransferase [Bacilli bacterium]|nr:16S rRNA (cytidine(1402)-2'-O)-methyltransferase [Acholeplasmataceae bacterium]HOE77073.1 16S rRNA (cytidine(1402)-2'-O)-methyltransferase [Bacilli bacterium]HON63544.1 16S rRNA (cytidine(1402)-2'-O)-methyltransferase [Bacilli bacterium]HOR95702.1 16S rRNA (cytidine(1402)-2'-O)-methyltransferase [Bacilli bacterium]HPD12333.1 16S rRNA (cytidine(1402)-2'-O)-methyltransferase [Bacilli bacterium]